MKAVVWHGRGDVRVEEVAYAPSPGPGEVRVAVEWCGICGTDLEERRSGPHFVPLDPHPLTGRMAPLVLGHEVAGRVADLGDEVEGLEEGDLIGLDALIGCGQCWYCQRHQINLCRKLAAIGLMADGGLSEAVTVPAAMCIPIPAAVKGDSAALAEPVAVAVRGLRRGRAALGDSVAILGAGMIGLATLCAARACGASQILVADPLEERRSLALSLGADAALDPTTGEFLQVTRDRTEGRGVDIAVDAAGSALSGPQAIEATRPGGRTVIVGLSSTPAIVDLFALAGSEKEVLGSLSHIADEDFVAAVRLLASGVLTAERIGAVKVPLESAVTDGFDVFERPNAPVKILVGSQA